MRIPTAILLIGTLLLIFMSAYFSSSETAMMKLNPYRLKHMVSEGHRGARKANRLLRRQDRLLGVILIGNNLVNNCAAIIAAIICSRWFGDTGGPVVGAIAITLIMLVFAEVAPKTIAAERPETIAFPSSFVLTPLEKILSPVVTMVKFCASILVNPFVKHVDAKPSSLSIDELRTVVGTESDIDNRPQEMLLGILDLGKAKVNDIMVRRTDVEGIDLEHADREIVDDLLHANHTRLPVFEGELDNVMGVLHLKRSGRLLHPDHFDVNELRDQLEEPYFTPNGTPLSTQLINFQKEKTRFAFVVDEYGTIQGIVTLEDILEEIVGEFTTDVAEGIADIYPQEDGSYVINGYVLLRDINARLSWSLPTDGPRTLNGLMLEHLEDIPDANVGLKIGNYLCETVKVGESALPSIRVLELESPEPATDDDGTDAIDDDSSEELV